MTTAIRTARAGDSPQARVAVSQDRHGCVQIHRVLAVSRSVETIISTMDKASCRSLTTWPSDAVSYSPAYQSTYKLVHRRARGVS